MSKLDVGLIRVLLLVGALAVANGYVAWTSRSLEAQGPDPSCGFGAECEFPETKCTFPVPLPGNTCVEYPGFSCSLSTCTETALEP